MAILNQVIEYCRWLFKNLGVNGVAIISFSSILDDNMTRIGWVLREMAIFSKSLENHMFLVKFGKGVKWSVSFGNNIFRS